MEVRVTLYLDAVREFGLSSNNSRSVLLDRVLAVNHGGP